MGFKRIVSLILVIQISVFSCADGFDYADIQFNFLKPRTQPFANITRDIKSSATYNNLYWFYENINKETNLKEWQKYLKTKEESFTIKHLDEILYKKKNIQRISNKEVLKYIEFVQKQEDYVVSRYYYNKKTKKADIQTYINEALKNLEKTSSQWLKLRYFFLAFRLAHYKNENPLQIYKKYKYLLKNSENSIVKDWIIGIYAGSLVKNKQVVEGVYEFTKLFDKNKINWYLSFYNFHHIKTNAQWEKLLNLAKTNDEKAKMYAIRSLNYNSNKLEELQNIYKLDKNSKWFDYILYRYLLDTQHQFNDYEQYEYTLGEKKVFSFKPYINYLKSIKKDEMYILDLSLGYLHLYEEMYKEASFYEQKLLKEYPNSFEIKTFSYILYLNKLEKIDKKTEDEIYEKLNILLEEKQKLELKKSLKYPIYLGNYYNAYKPINNSIKNYTFVITKKLYEKQGDKFKAFLSKNINYLPLEAFDLTSFKEFEEYIKKPASSKLMNYIKEEYKKNDILAKTTKTKLGEDMKKTKIKLLINNLKFQKALNIEALYQNSKIEFNPFNGVIRGNNREGKKFQYTVKKFLQTITKLQDKLKKNPSAVIDNYLYANALYNLSYFGNSNMLTTVYRSVYGFHKKQIEYQKLNLAKKHYEKALKNSKKREFKAKINYMLAKVELALYDVKFAKDDEWTKGMYFHPRKWDSQKAYKKYIQNNYGKYFNILKDEYENTNYYKEVIKECSNLRLYRKIKKGN